MAALFHNNNSLSTYSYYSNVTHSSDISPRFDGNISDDSYSSEIAFDQIERVLSVLGIVLNVSTIVILMSLKGPLKSQFKLMLSLAISDSFIDLLHFILSFYYFPNLFKLHKSAYFGPALPGVVFSFLYSTVQYAGLGTMCAIAVDILIKVRHPFRYQTLMSKGRVNVIITCLWLIPSLCSVITAVCIIYDVGLSSRYVLLTFVIYSLVYCLFSMLFFFIFIIIYTVILCSVRTFMSMQPPRHRRSNTKMAVTFFLIIVSYFVCIMPGLWMVLLSISDIDSSIPVMSVVITNSVSCLYILNTLIDPIIYALRVPEVRARYLTICRRMCHSIDVCEQNQLRSD